MAGRAQGGQLVVRRKALELGIGMLARSGLAERGDLVVLQQAGPPADVDLGARGVDEGGLLAAPRLSGFSSQADH